MTNVSNNPAKIIRLDDSKCFKECYMFVIKYTKWHVL